jgi:hypothetical protein
MNDKKRYTFYLNSKLYEKFKKSCNKKGLIVSKRIEMFIGDEVKKENGNANK